MDYAKENMNEIIHWAKCIYQLLNTFKVSEMKISIHSGFLILR